MSESISNKDPLPKNKTELHLDVFFPAAASVGVV